MVWFGIWVSISISLHRFGKPITLYRLVKAAKTLLLMRARSAYPATRSRLLNCAEGLRLLAGAQYFFSLDIALFTCYTFPMKRLLSSLTDAERAAYFAVIDSERTALVAAAPSKCQECATPLNGKSLLCDACVCMLGIEAGFGARATFERNGGRERLRKRADEIDYKINKEAPRFGSGISFSGYDDLEEDPLPTPYELVALKVRARKLAGAIAFASNETAEHIEYKIFQYVARMHYRESYTRLTFWQFDIGLRVLEGIQQYESAAIVINELRKTERKKDGR